MHPITVYFLAMNTLAFLFNGTDKWLAVRQKSRISEKMLLGLALTGGSIGSLTGMLLFRHKISKASFLWKFFGIVMLQLLFVYFIWKS
ncbi:hypothetical protein FCR2A7T_04920 [Flavobacterium cauense R2A-7]|uniref:Uncharacterized membrane protein YsdA (DUF1294 family) n=1 Tax=Flavobacterium cauense R2A-7 TaxID=1341154 RepID=V6S6X5_9FLAO|nr:DUF1294 domain-containing protein [Flavobacterium cauense]ESU22022.1 hypothetical protein FCR2A7T_04920 [Flavobacterium cauense R2A-7]KGO81313.1 hypothetical protein Q762_08795 [Flavobacterium cauense R2A-7]TWI13241.1 uncharacterized membrane protein YsdA (DUF1294 family) [Flavobacterium cauense R2A-7]